MHDESDASAATPQKLDPASLSPERFDPAADGGKLVHAEHVARYLWAAELASGRVVLDAGCGTGYGSELLAGAGAERLMAIDASAEAVRLTAERLGTRGEVTQADARKLPFADASFDLIVCFEVIEHIDGADRAMAEFARTLRPDGILVISSPNPRVYLQGNPHHVHEFVPEELQAALETHFPHVRLATQRAWLGSLIAGDDQLDDLQGASPAAASAVSAEAGEEREGTYVLAVAGHGAAPLPGPRLVVGGGFEVAWWMEKVTAAESRLSEALREREFVSARARETEERLAELEARVLEIEQDRARLLSERPQLEQAAADLQRARAVMTDLQESVSWKLTTPLRSGKQIALRARRPQR